MLKRFKNQLEQLQKSEEYISFKKKHSDAYLSGGFVIVEETKLPDSFDWQIDFYSPDEKKVYTFVVHNDRIEVKDPDKVFQIHKKDLNKLNIEKFELSPHQVIDIIKEDNEKNNRKVLPMKVICTMQNIDSIDVYNIIIITMQFSVLNARVNAQTGEILKISQQNVMEFGSVEKGKGNN